MMAAPWLRHGWSFLGGLFVKFRVGAYAVRRMSRNVPLSNRDYLLVPRASLNKNVKIHFVIVCIGKTDKQPIKFASTKKVVEHCNPPMNLSAKEVTPVDDAMASSTNVDEMDSNLDVNVPSDGKTDDEEKSRLKMFVDNICALYWAYDCSSIF
jgi:hypothetical protein